MISVELTNRQSRFPVDETALAQAVEQILHGEGILDAWVSLAIVDNPEIHRVNREFLNHDYPTDCISFLLQEEPPLEGEVIVSVDTAEVEGPRHGWTRDEELLLYVVHATLHLVGYDDLVPEAAVEMRAREDHYLTRFGHRIPNRSAVAELSSGGPEDPQG
jgi:probable rRNA maturation factor